MSVLTRTDDPTTAPEAAGTPIDTSARRPGVATISYIDPAGAQHDVVRPSPARR